MGPIFYKFRYDFVFFAKTFFIDIFMFNFFVEIHFVNVMICTKCNDLRQPLSIVKCISHDLKIEYI